MWKHVQGRCRIQLYTSWEGMVNLMNTCLVANTLLLSIDIVTMGFMKNKQDISSWGKEIVSWYWITLPLSICSHGSVSVYATALLCILSFIDHKDEEKMSAFHKWFNYSIHFIGKGTVLNFWLTGMTIIASVAFLIDDEFQFEKMRLIFRYSSIFMICFLLYVLYVIKKIFPTRVEPTNVQTIHEENSISTTMNEIEDKNLDSVLREIDDTFPERYLNIFEEAFVTLPQLRELDACQISQNLHIPLGHAIQINSYLKSK